MDLQDRLADQREALSGANEGQTEERWIKPVLNALGWGYEVQPVSKRHGTVQYPDYALFLSQERADGAAAEDRRRLLKRSDGVLEAKRWERDLDAGDPEYEDINRVPSTQIINYLTRAGQPWGILTNGVEWRLYYRDADFADTSYFAMDLPALLSEEPMSIGERAETISPEEAFRYFYLFFRPEAFRVEAEDMRWLDLAYDRSMRYARAVEERLKPRAYRAVEALCRGFAAAHDIEPGEIEEDDELADTLLDNALTLLFRLLFLHYAESRDLLPVRTNPAYRRKSLLALRERAAEQREGGEPFFPKGRDYWSDLRDLFQIVNGDPEWQAVGVPVYNGGLFDPEKHPWLEGHYVADPQLAEALDLLSRTQDPETDGLHYVDYGPLDVRNLGSIYEGLLEHKLRVAEKEQPAVQQDGRTIRDPVGEGELYLANEKGERKVTGSFYTPDYVVEYIVENTLKPQVEGRDPSEILELTVLDPAMGSGHFLVEATSYLARAAVRSVEEGDQNLLGEFAELDPEELRRLVVERCIFGVDKNPRAVELAKLSLWIATVQRGKPLNFLDHHLKCGDSLLGARVTELASLPGRSSKDEVVEGTVQMNAFEQALRRKLGRVLTLVHTIERLFSDSLEDVQRKEEMYREVDELLDRFRSVADVWCSALLGNEDLFETDDQGNDRSESRYARAVEALQAPPSQWEKLGEEPWFQEARRLADEHNFFHWGVEFSEVFYREEGGERENPGFDAVIGNPPYVRMEEFKGLKDFLGEIYETHASRTDLYVYFMERSVGLLREGGEYGVIVSNKFLRANYGRGIRRLLGEQTAVREIVDFGGLAVFPDATVRSAVVHARKGDDRTHPSRYARIPDLEFDELERYVNQVAYEVPDEGVRGEDWRLVPRDAAALMDKLAAQGTSLGELIQGDVLRGVVTGRNKAFCIDEETRDRLIAEDPTSEEVIKPLVVGSEVRPFRLERDDQWMLYLPHGVEINRYPAVENYLETFRDQLEGRATEQAWYELQQPQEAYSDYFEAEKIVFPDMAKVPRFSFDEEGLYPSNTVYFLPVKDQALVALLNSSVAHFHFQFTCALLEGEEDAYLRFFGQYMEEIPLWVPEQRDGAEEAGDLSSWLRRLYRYALHQAELVDDPLDLDLQEFAVAVKNAAGQEPVDPGALDTSRGIVAGESYQAILAQIEDWQSAAEPVTHVAVQEFLAFLAQTMSDLHEKRLQEIDSFLTWLEDQLGCPVDDLSGKTFVRAYYEQPEGVDKLLETIEKNRPSTTELDVRQPEEYGEENLDRNLVVSGYRRSMKNLQPILDQLKLTDELIDQIVYRLYELTDEEIAVVEEYVS